MIAARRERVDAIKAKLRPMLQELQELHEAEREQLAAMDNDDTADCLAVESWANALDDAQTGVQDALDRLEWTR